MFAQLETNTNVSMQDAVRARVYDTHARSMEHTK